MDSKRHLYEQIADKGEDIRWPDSVVWECAACGKIALGKGKEQPDEYGCKPVEIITFQKPSHHKDK